MSRDIKQEEVHLAKPATTQIAPNNYKNTSWCSQFSSLSHINQPGIELSTEKTPEITRNWMTNLSHANVTDSGAGLAILIDSLNIHTQS